MSTALDSPYTYVLKINNTWSHYKEYIYITHRYVVDEGILKGKGFWIAHMQAPNLAFICRLRHNYICILYFVTIDC